MPSGEGGETISLHCVTWNVQKVAAQPMSWLAGGAGADICVVGLQDIGHGSSHEWAALTQRTVNDDAYVLLSCQQLLGIMLAVWVKRELAVRVTGVVAHTVDCGVHGPDGNTGGVGISLNVGATRLSIVCAHLATGDRAGCSSQNAAYRAIDRAFEDEVQASEKADTPRKWGRVARQLSATVRSPTPARQVSLSCACMLYASPVHSVAMHCLD